MATILPSRSEIPEKYQWNAQSVFKDRAAWETAVGDCLTQIETIGQFKGRLGASPAVLAEFFVAYDRLYRLASKIQFYAGMSASVDSTDAEAVAMRDRAGGLLGQMNAAVAFMNPELIAIGPDTLEQWRQQEPRLNFLGHFFDDLFRQQRHIRSAEVEEVLGLTQVPFDSTENIFRMLTTADMQFPPAVDSQGQRHDVAQSSLNTLLDHPDRELRRSAHDSYYGQYLAFKNTLTAAYLTAVKQATFEARARGYESSIAASLSANHVPLSVYDNLIATYKKNIPTWQRYWKVRRRILGVEQLHPYDVWAPLAQATPPVPFEQAVDWIGAGLQPLGDDYVAILRKGCLADRWVDVYPNRGKRQGAFSWGAYDTSPFIMMSYNHSLFSLSTLAHELGHALHSYHSRKTQPSLYAGYSLFVAEVASNFNQAMVRAYLQAINPDPNFQIAVIEEAMSNFHRYFFIMPILAAFEREVHGRVERGMGLTADDLITICADLFAEGYGSEMTYDRESAGITWATFSHLYTYFYVYQYATGISAANLLARQILTGDASAVQRYREFLCAGGSLYPLDALQHAGVDMTTPAAVETTFDVLAEMVDRLEQLAK